MKNKRFLAMSFLIVLLSAVPAWAGHVVWVDFSGFNLNAWSEVNGNDPPKSSDLTAIKKLVVANMTEDYATFDVVITTAKPANGRFTRIKVLGIQAEDADGNTLFGCAGGACCKKGDCTGLDSWDDMMESALEVYSGSFAEFSDFIGSNATTARIANGISGTASHELGHILGMEHCRAADDSFTVGCSEFGTPDDTKDQNPRWHIMASGSSWDLTEAERATRDRFFSAHSERRVLASAVQLRNHFAPLANLNGGGGPFADLTYGRLSSPNVMKWFTRLSSGSDFFNFTEWAADAGNAGDIFLTGDVNNDGRADLVYGRIESSTQVTWFVRKSNGSGYGSFSEWAADAGDSGDIFRLADVNNDGKADLVYGRPLDATTVRWFVRKSDGSNFGNFTTWADDAGDVGDLFFLADVDKDGDADLVSSRATSATEVQWVVRRSDGSKFGSAETWHSNAGDKGDLMYVGDANGDGKADLVYGRVSSTFDVTWFFRKGTGFIFGNLETWADDAGDAGDLFRLGDTTGDGKLDLMFGRPKGLLNLTTTPDLKTVRWFGRSSLGTGFSSFTTWADDAGDEGDYFP
jgi:hypothetical protein